MTFLDPEVLALLANLPAPTEHERQAQALCFAYGNLACTENHRPIRHAFRRLARERYGWHDDEFNRWAVGRVFADDHPADECVARSRSSGYYCDIPGHPRYRP